MFWSKVSLDIFMSCEHYILASLTEFVNLKKENIQLKASLTSSNNNHEENLKQFECTHIRKPVFYCTNNHQTIFYGTNNSLSVRISHHVCKKLFVSCVI